MQSYRYQSRRQLHLRTASLPMARAKYARSQAERAGFAWENLFFLRLLFGSRHFICNVYKSTFKCKVHRKKIPREHSITAEITHKL